MNENTPESLPPDINQETILPTTNERISRKKIPRHKAIIVFVLLIILGVLSVIVLYKVHEHKRIAETDITVPVRNVPGYPMSVYPGLPDGKLNQIKDSFLQTMDKQKFGDDQLEVLVGPMGYIASISIGKGNYDLLTSYDNAEKAYWTNFMIQNATYFGITDPQSFQLNYEYDKNLSETVLSAYQKIGGQHELYEDQNTRIEVSKFQIEGHFWPNPKVPSKANFSPEDIEKQLIGKPYTYDVPQTLACANCNEAKPTLETVVLKKSDVSVQLAPYFYTKESADGNFGASQLRLVYLVSITLPDESQYPMFDAITGEHL